MSLIELLPALKDLSPADKLEALQFLGQELADDAQGRSLIVPYLMNWSPREIAPEAGQAILAALKEDRRAHAGRCERIQKFGIGTYRATFCLAFSLLQKREVRLRGLNAFFVSSVS